MTTNNIEQLGVNNTYTIVRYTRPRPYHEDTTSNAQPFEPSAVRPGQLTRIRIDLKHGSGREVVLNEILLCFRLKCPAACKRAYIVRATDLIRELVVKFNDDEVFKVDKSGELSLMWELAVPGKLSLTEPGHDDSSSFVRGNIPTGRSLDEKADFAKVSLNQSLWTRPLDEKFDGKPRLVWSEEPSYVMDFEIPLSQLTDGIFHKFHARRLEYLCLEIMFEPYVSLADSQRFIKFEDTQANDHWGNTVITDLKVKQYRSTYLANCCVPPVVSAHLPLMWVHYFMSKRTYQVDLDIETSWDIKLNDWEIRHNVNRIYWMLAPMDPANDNDFVPLGSGPHEPIAGAVLRWKNDEVIELHNTYDVYRHYLHAQNKRTHHGDPHREFPQLFPYKHNSWGDEYVLNQPVASHQDADGYALPIFFVDLNMNTRSNPSGTRVNEGITNDTSDYSLTIKKLDDQEYRVKGKRTLWVWLEYPKGVSLAAHSNFSNKASQKVSTFFN